MVEIVPLCSGGTQSDDGTAISGMDRAGGGIALTSAAAILSVSYRFRGHLAGQIPPPRAVLIDTIFSFRATTEDK